MTHWTSIIVYVVFYLISSLVIYTRVDVMSEWANVTTCIGTYADIYKSLASDKNSCLLIFQLLGSVGTSYLMVYNIDDVRSKPLANLSDGKRGNGANTDVPSEDQARDIYIYIYIYIYI